MCAWVRGVNAAVWAADLVCEGAGNEAGGQGGCASEASKLCGRGAAVGALGYDGNVMQKA